MSKRFTDTEIWNKFWFRKLTPRLKETWRYLCDKCDNAGVWEIDMEALVFNVGENVSFDEIKETFGDRVNHFCEEKIFIPGFIHFQYKCSVEGLNPANKAHKSVIDRLKRLGLFKPLGSPLNGDKEQDKEQDKDIIKKNIRREELLKGVESGLIKIGQYLLEFPEPDLEKDAVEVIEFMRKTKNPKSKTPPIQNEVERLIKNWLFSDGIPKEMLIKVIKGAGTNDFETKNLQVGYILNPDHTAKLLMMEENSSPKKRTSSDSDKNFRFPKTHGNGIKI